MSKRKSIYVYEVIKNKVDFIPMRTWLNTFSDIKEAGKKWNIYKNNINNNICNNYGNAKYIKDKVNNKIYYFGNKALNSYLIKTIEGIKDKADIILNNKQNLIQIDTIYKTNVKFNSYLKNFTKEFYPVDYIFNLKEFKNCLKFGVRISHIILDGDIIRINSQLLRTFCFKGTKCTNCGLQANYLIKEKNIGQSGWHLALYSIKNNSYIPFTKDHILPRSKGGTDNLDNLQPMCYKCNYKKSNNISKKENLKILFNDIIVFFKNFYKYPKLTNHK